MTVGLLAPPGGDLATHPATAALVALGLMDPSATALAPVEDLSRAHPVWRVIRPDGRRWVVKEGRRAGGPDLAVECLVYRLAAWCDPVAAALPTPVAIDEDRQVLVLEDVTGPGCGSLAQQIGLPALLLGSSSGVDVGCPVEVAGLIGSVLGGLHQATAGFPLPPAPPPIVLAALGPSRVPMPGPMSGTATALLAQPGLLEAAAEMAGPVTGCLVNHDLKWDNIVVSDADPARPVLLDWELAGLGDPAWDLGCLLAEHQVRSVTLDHLDAGAAALLGHYAVAARLRLGVRPAYARRVGLATVLRLAQLALEVANMPASVVAQGADRLIALARRQLGDLPALTQEVSRCLS